MLESGNFQELLEPKYRKVFFEAYTELDEEFPQIYNMQTSKKAKEYDYHVSSTGMWDEKLPGQAISEEGIEHGYEVTYIHHSYAKMITIEREFSDDELYGVLEKLPRGLGRGCRATVETYAAAPINNGFTTNGYDSVPLFSNSHPMLKGGTCDNLMTASALSHTELDAGRLLMTQQKTEEGLKMQAKASQLIIPPDLETTAMKILNSEKVDSDANNAVNPLKGSMKIIVMNYLTDTNAWFLRDPRLSETNFFWRVKPEFKSTNNFDNMVAKYRGYCRFSCGYSDWRGWVGNVGA
jgi:phage major head subunit gpT-like protein